jgi:hypothetical protein
MSIVWGSSAGGPVFPNEPEVFHPSVKTQRAVRSGDSVRLPQLGHSQRSGGASGLPQPGHSQRSGGASGLPQPGHSQRSGGTSGLPQPGHSQRSGGASGLPQPGHLQQRSGEATRRPRSPDPSGDTLVLPQPGHSQRSGVAAGAQPGDEEVESTAQLSRQCKNLTREQIMRLLRLKVIADAYDATGLPLGAAPFDPNFSGEWNKSNPYKPDPYDRRTWKRQWQHEAQPFSDSDEERGAMPVDPGACVWFASKHV